MPYLPEPALPPTSPAAAPCTPLQKQRQGTGGSDGSYDLLSYVEFTNMFEQLGQL